MIQFEIGGCQECYYCDYGEFMFENCTMILPLRDGDVLINLIDYYFLTTR